MEEPSGEQADVWGEALAWKKEERDKLEGMQMEMGRWIWAVPKEVRKVSIQKETGWSTFEEREARMKMRLLRRIIDGENKVSEVGRACLMEIGKKSKWWSGVMRMADAMEIRRVGDLITYGRVSLGGLNEIGGKEEEVSQRVMEDKIRQYGNAVWNKKCQGSVRLEAYGERKWDGKLERYADGSVGAKVRMMMRGDSLVVRGSRNMEWRYRDRRCECGGIETESHVMLQCRLYEEERRDWMDMWMQEKGEGGWIQGMLGYEECSEGLEREIMDGMGRVWRARERREQERKRREGEG